jgi:isoleucyl-tRNA synthetase
MSKSLQNYPDPMKVFDTYGADAMRWYLLSSAILRGTDFSVTEQGIRDTVRQVLLPLWNSWYFLSLYANAENKSGAVSTESSNLLDRYILAKLQRTTVDVTLSMDKYDLFAACQQVRTFLDVLTNWYIRRSRDRFWAGDQDAINTLHTVLEVLVRLAAPLLPLITENIHAGLVANADSVHLRDWPSSEALPIDDELVDAMDLVRDVCSATLSVRKAHSRRVRLPLGSLTVAVANAEALASYVTIISDEVNVKSVMLRSDVAAVASFELQVVPAALGPRLGKKTQQVIGAVKRGEWSRVDDAIAVAGEILTEGEYLLKLVTSGDEPSATLSHGSGIVMLDIEVTPDLEAEGLARDIIRAVQQARRDEELHVSDRISLTVAADSAVEAQVGPFVALVMAETLATELLWDQQGAREISIEGHMIGVLVKIAR